MEYEDENAAEDAKEGLDKKEFGGLQLNICKYPRASLCLGPQVLTICLKNGARNLQSLTNLRLLKDPSARKERNAAIIAIRQAITQENAGLAGKTP